ASSLSLLAMTLRERCAKPLLLLRPDPADALDRQWRAAGFFGDLAVLFHDVAARRLVAVEAAEQFGRHTAVGALRVVFIDDVEKGELAFGIGSGFLRHRRLVFDQGAPVNRNGLALGSRFDPAAQ